MCGIIIPLVVITHVNMLGGLHHPFWRARFTCSDNDAGRPPASVRCHAEHLPGVLESWESKRCSFSFFSPLQLSARIGKYSGNHFVQA